MDGTDSLLLQEASRLLRDTCGDAERGQAEAGEWPEALWNAVEAFGLPLALVEDFSMEDAMAVIRLAGEVAAPLPLAETMVANWLLRLAGLPPVAGPATVVMGSGLRLEGGRLAGSADRVAWGRVAAPVAVVEQDGRSWLVRPDRGGVAAAPGANIAHEPRDRLRFDAAAEGAELPIGGDAVFAVMAAARCCQMAGAMSAVADITVEYVMGREQFGRPLAKFQAIQQSLAVLAGAAAAARAAADLAAEAAGATPVGQLAIAAAKVRVGEAAGQVAAIAHQAHGAMGVTFEYRLHPLTRRLWSWRDEWGGESRWAAELGRAMAAAGPDHLWAALTAI